MRRLALLLLTSCAGQLVGPSFERFDLKQTPRPEDYPDVAAVVLLDRGDWRLSVHAERGTPVARLRRYRRVKVLRPSGIEHAEILIPFEPGTAVTDVIARAVLPDGATRSFRGDPRVERTARGLPALRFVVPEVEVGAVIEYAWDHHFEDLRFLPPWLFRERLPVLRSEVALLVPPAYAINYRYLDGGAPVDRPPERFEIDGGTRLFWAETKQPPMFPEPGMPEPGLIAPQVRFNFVRAKLGEQSFDGFSSWEEVRTWFAKFAGDWQRLNEPQIDEAKKVAGETSQEEQALKLLTIIARDLAWQPGQDLPVFLTWVPSANTTLDNRVGNATSRGLVLTALLRAAGLPAFPALAAYRDRGRLFPDFPDVRAIDAVVSVIPRPSGPLVLDPTQLTADADVASPRLQGTRILMLREDVAELVDVPVSAAKDSVTSMRYDLRIDGQGTIVGTMEAKLTGAEAGALRAQLAALPPERYPEAVSSFLGRRGAALPLDSASIADLGALRRPLSIRGNLSFAGGHAEKSAESAAVSLGRLIGDLSPAPAERRRSRIDLGPPRTTELVVTLMFPDDHELEDPALAFRSEYASGFTTIDVRRETPRRVGVRRVDERRALFIEVDGYDDFRRHVERVAAAEKTTVYAKRPPPRSLEY